MTWFVLALMAIASAAAVALALQSRADRVAAAKLGARVEALITEVGTVTRQLGAEATAHVDTRERLEKVVAQQKAELARLEGLLDENLDASLVRDRLAGSGLFRSPEEGTTAADSSTAAAGLPPRPTAILGAGGGGSRREG